MGFGEWLIDGGWQGCKRKTRHLDAGVACTVVVIYLCDTCVEVEVDKTGHDEFVCAVDYGGWNRIVEIFGRLVFFKNSRNQVILDDDGCWEEKSVVVVQGQD